MRERGGFRGGRGGRGSFDGRPRRRGGSFGNSRGFGFGGSRGGGFGRGFSDSGGYPRGRSRGFSRGGESSGRGFSRFSSSGSISYGGRYDDDMDQNGGYDKFEKYSKYDRYEKDYTKEEPTYIKYPVTDKYSAYGSSTDKYAPYSSGTRKESYRSRSPLDMPGDGYRSSSPSYIRNRSRSPFGRPVRNTYSSRNYEENPKSLSPGAREVFRRPRSKSSRNYSSDRSEEPSSHSYGRKEYVSSSHGSRRRSPMDGRF